MSPYALPHWHAASCLRPPLFGRSAIMRAGDSAVDVLAACGLCEDWTVPDRIARERIARLGRRREKELGD